MIPQGFDAARIASTVSSEAEALDLIHALRSRFGLQGVEFAPGDVGGYVESVRMEAGFPGGYERDLIGVVTESECYRQMVDRLADIGTRIVDDEVNSLVRDVFRDAVAFRMILRSGRGGPVSGVQSPSFDSAEHAHQWGLERLGRPLVEVWEDCEVKGPVLVPDRITRVDGMALLVLHEGEDGTTEALRLNWAGPDVSG